MAKKVAIGLPALPALIKGFLLGTASDQTRRWVSWLLYGVSTALRLTVWLDGSASLGTTQRLPSKLRDLTIRPWKAVSIPVVFQRWEEISDISLLGSRLAK